MEQMCLYFFIYSMYVISISGFSKVGEVHRVLLPGLTWFRLWAGFHLVATNQINLHMPLLVQVIKG